MNGGWTIALQVHTSGGQKIQENFFCDKDKNQWSEYLSRLEVGPICSISCGNMYIQRGSTGPSDFFHDGILWVFISVLSGLHLAFIFSKEVERESVVLSYQFFKQNFRLFGDFPP